MVHERPMTMSPAPETQTPIIGDIGTGGVVAPSTPTVESLAPPSDQLNVRLLTSEDAFVRLAEAWDSLSADIPFRRVKWSESWWQHYRRPNTALRILAVEDNNANLLGLAPWYSERSLRGGRVIRFLGSGEVCSDYVTILSQTGCEQIVARRIADWLSNDFQGQWDSIELDGVQEGDVSIAALVAQLKDGGARIDRPTAQQCWRIEFPDNWDAYLGRLSRKRRERVRAFVRRMFDSKRAIWNLAQTEAEVARGYEILIELHQRRRASLEEKGCFASETFTAFHREMLGKLWSEGRARIHWIELEGRPIAVEYDLIGARTVYVYQTGIDPDAVEHSPGWLSAIASIRSALEGGFASFDFLRGDEPYKATLRGEPVAMQTVLLTAPNTKAQWRRRIRRSIRFTKDHLKQHFHRS